MVNFNDFDHFKLQPNEVLILRPRESSLTLEQAEQLTHTLRRQALRVVVLASSNLDMMAATVPAGMDARVEALEGAVVALRNLVGDKPEQPAPTQEEIEAMRDHITKVYEDGGVIEYRAVDSDQWMVAHKRAWPHEFNWGDYFYRLPKRTQGR